jgi:hypothetical protein
MRKPIAILAAALAVVALTGNNYVRGEAPLLDRSVLLTEYQETKTGDDLLALDPDDCCAAMEDCPVLSYCGPRWTVTLGAEIKQRNDMPEFTLVEGAGGKELMATSDIDVGWGSGPRLEIARHMDCGWDLEAVYFGIDNFDGSAVAYDGTPVATWFWEQFVFDELYGSYRNELYSAEFNVKWPLCEDGRFKGIAGFRWIELHEELYAEVTSAGHPLYGTTAWGSLDLGNQLYGFQLGAEGILWEPCCQFRVEGSAKAGIYGNHADWLRKRGSILGDECCGTEECQSAFVSEFALMGVYQPCCWLKAFAGWQALHLKEVATGSVQQKEIDVIFDHAFYHGVVLGLEISFGSRYCGGCAGPCCSCE